LDVISEKKRDSNEARGCTFMWEGR